MLQAVTDTWNVTIPVLQYNTKINDRAIRITQRLQNLNTTIRDRATKITRRLHNNTRVTYKRIELIHGLQNKTRVTV